MAICPHCNSDSIGILAGHLKWRDSPVTCPNCGGASFRDRSGGPNLIVGLIVGSMFLWWPILILLTESWWSAFAPVLVLVAIYVPYAVIASRRTLLLGKRMRNPDDRQRYPT